MMRLRPAIGAALLAAAACEQNLTVPGQCPEFCPGGNAQVAELVIPATVDGDSTHVGYIGALEAPALLVSDGLAAGEARAWYQFPSRPDTVFVDEWMPYTIDSVALSVPIVGLDTLAPDLRLILHRIPITVDTLLDFTALDALFTDETVIDTLVFPDTLRAGHHAVLVLTGDALSRLEIPVEDDGHLGVGVRLLPGTGSGVRIGSITGGTGPATWVTYARVDVSDEERQHQVLAFAADGNGYVIDRPPVTTPDVLLLGGLPSARSILRFSLPLNVRDSAIVLRATLELEPAEPLSGVRNDPGVLEVRGVFSDQGAKSTPAFGVSGVRSLPVSGSEVVSVEVQRIVDLWRGASGLPQVLYLSLLFEGGTFPMPAFRSTRSAAGGPRLRITYLVPGAAEQP